MELLWKLQSLSYCVVFLPFTLICVILLECFGLVAGFLGLIGQYFMTLFTSTIDQNDSNAHDKVLIVIVHGLGGSSKPSSSLLGLKRFLQRKGFPKISLFEYSSFRISLREAAQHLEVHIDEQTKILQTSTVLLVGFSAGGRVSLLCNHKAVRGVVAVVTPIQGSAPARLLTFLWPSILFCPPILKDLREGADFKPSTPRHAAVSAELIFGFDCKVLTREMTSPATCSSTHIKWMSHNFCQIDPRCHRGALLLSGCTPLLPSSGRALTARRPFTRAALRACTVHIPTHTRVSVQALLSSCATSSPQVCRRHRRRRRRHHPLPPAGPSALPPAGYPRPPARQGRPRHFAAAPWPWPSASLAAGRHSDPDVTQKSPDRRPALHPIQTTRPSESPIRVARARAHTRGRSHGQAPSESPAPAPPGGRSS